MIIRTVSLVLFFLFFIGWGPARGLAQADAPRSIFEFLSARAPAEINLHADWEAFINNRREEEYQLGKLVVSTGRRASTELNVKVRLRGKYRRRVCDFPPVKLKFAKKELEEMGLDPRFNSLKLVTHCLDDKATGDDNLLREFLVYQLYQTLAPESYRVHLARIVYHDEGERFKRIRRYGFIIEDNKELAHRIGAVDCDTCYSPEPCDMNLLQTTQMALFQFMVGNADWNIPMLRNLTYLKREDTPGLLIPYDFDFSGLVNASYALPNTDFEMRGIRERIFLGYPVEDPVMRRAIERFQSRREAMERVVREFTLLSAGSRDDILAYLDAFFQLLEGLDEKDLYGQLAGKRFLYNAEEKSIDQMIPIENPKIEWGFKGSGER
jgi:hypothetical protein